MNVPRVRVDLGDAWKQSIVERVEPAIIEALGHAPLSETEIFTVSLTALGAKENAGELIKSVKKMYSLNFRKKLSDGSAYLSVVNNLKKAVNVAKSNMSDPTYCKGKYGVVVRNSGRSIQFGDVFHGKIFYIEGPDSKEELRKKATLLIKGSESCASHIISILEKDGYVAVSSLPFQRRVVDLAKELLEHFGIAKTTLMKGAEIIHTPEFQPQTINLNPAFDKVSMKEAEYFSSHGFIVWSNFYAGAWSITENGPAVIRFKFDLVAFDKKNFQLHVADISKKRAGLGELQSLRRKVKDWGLPAVMHYFAPSFTPSAEKYAMNWGIQLQCNSKPE